MKVESICLTLCLGERDREKEGGRGDETKERDGTKEERCVQGKIYEVIIKLSKSFEVNGCFKNSCCMTNYLTHGGVKIKGNYDQRTNMILVC